MCPSTIISFVQGARLRVCKIMVIFDQASVDYFPSDLQRSSVQASLTKKKENLYISSCYVRHSGSNTKLISGLLSLEKHRTTLWRPRTQKFSSSTKTPLLHGPSLNLSSQSSSYFSLPPQKPPLHFFPSSVASSLSAFW
jgi:hypothetical protein